jgi:predicted DNA-binding protein (MmcQ/YjbR family)
MNIEEIREFCIGKKGVTEGFPFDDTTLVFKVQGKIFALLILSGESRINLKCEPEKAIELREQHEFIIPGYHMSKKHWNTIDLIECNSDKLLIELINHSHSLVVQSLTRKLRNELELL